MVRVRVRMYATVREAAGTAEAEVEASTLDGVFTELSRRFGSRMTKMLSSAAKGDDRLVVLLNGRNVSRRKGAEPKLGEGDEVALFPPVSGG